MLRYQHRVRHQSQRWYVSKSTEKFLSHCLCLCSCFCRASLHKVQYHGMSVCERLIQCHHSIHFNTDDLKYPQNIILRCEQKHCSTGSFASASTGRLRTVDDECGRLSTCEECLQWHNSTQFSSAASWVASWVCNYSERVALSWSVSLRYDRDYNQLAFFNTKCIRFLFRSSMYERHIGLKLLLCL